MNYRNGLIAGLAFVAGCASLQKGHKAEGPLAVESARTYLVRDFLGNEIVGRNYVAVNAFVDRNGNGRRDSGEQSVPIIVTGVRSEGGRLEERLMKARYIEINGPVIRSPSGSIEVDKASLLLVGDQ